MSETREFPGEPWDCAICGCSGDAFWAGEDSIAICRSCAIESLPRLIADAIANAYGPRVRNIDFVQQFNQVQVAFWQAATSALSSRLNASERKEVK